MRLQEIHELVTASVTCIIVAVPFEVLPCALESSASGSLRFRIGVFRLNISIKRDEIGLVFMFETAEPGGALFSGEHDIHGFSGVLHAAMFCPLFGSLR